MNISTAILPIELLSEDNTIREEFIEARTSKAPCMQFNKVEDAIEWVDKMKTKYGRFAPDYKLYLVEKSITRTLINT